MINRWMTVISQKIACKENYDMDLMEECSTFVNDVLNRAAHTFSGLLFWITTLYLIEMVLCAYFSMSFLFESQNREISPVKILFFFGFILVIFTLYSINCISQANKIPILHSFLETIGPQFYSFSKPPQTGITEYYSLSEYELHNKTKVKVIQS